MNGLPARTGLEWLKQGFALFRQQPGGLTMIAFANLLLSILLLNLPVLGVILVFLFIPCWIIAIQQACLMIDNGERVTPTVLLTGFRPGAIGPLCRLGAIYLGAFVVLLAAVSPWIDVDAIRLAAKTAQENKTPATIGGGTVLAMLSFFVLFGLATLSLCFAPALIHWKRMPTFKAVFYSVFANIGAIKAVLTMVFAWLAVGFALVMLVLLLFGRSQLMLNVVAMWLQLILMLIIQCGIYAAYKQIMGAPERDPKQP
jgi:hypothetical protein